MDASCSHPPDFDPTGSTASRFLANLPSRGFFSSTVISSNPVKDFTQGGMRVYVCQHDTTPPEGQHIKTNQTNILIRSLQLKKQKSDSSSKDVKGASVTEGSRKRSGGRLLDDRASAKKSNSSAGSLTVGSDNRTSDKEYYSLTVERLRALLKERGLSPKGRKDELVARWRSANG